MTTIEIILFVTTLISTSMAIFFGIGHSIHRDQLKLVQKQRREEKLAHAEGRMALTFEGLWADLDETDRLRDRVKELEKDQTP